jgi:hypothetical protein
MGALVVSQRILWSSPNESSVLGYVRLLPHCNSVELSYGVRLGDEPCENVGESRAEG